MVVSAHAERLLGRHRERSVIERLLDTARDGRGAVLVVHGDPGVGKTALLGYAIEAGRDFRIVRSAGFEGEMELDYAVLRRSALPRISRASSRRRLRSIISLVGAFVSCWRSPMPTGSRWGRVSSSRGCAEPRER
jgi:DNA helicase TIP49 (TBP-interacting protein)